jgi:hypothetical protein
MSIPRGSNSNTRRARDSRLLIFNARRQDSARAAQRERERLAAANARRLAMRRARDDLILSQRLNQRRSLRQMNRDLRSGIY